MAVLTVNGAPAPTPSEMKVTLFEVGSGDIRSASGMLVRDVTAVKRRLTLRWASLSPEQLRDLLNQVSGTFFQAEYPDPVVPQLRSATFRAGDAAMGVLKIVDGAPVWTDVTMEWTER